MGGKLSGGTESLLSVVQSQVEPSLVARGYNKGARPPGWIRPFIETPTSHRTPLENKVDDVEFPEKDESVGELQFIYRGPSPRDYLSRKVLTLLLYLNVL